MKPPHWRCRGCGIIITDCGSAPATCRFCQGTGGFDYMGYEDEYDLHKETEMYRQLHPVSQLAEEPKGLIFSGSNTSPDGCMAKDNLLSNIDAKGRRKNEK
jgi:hypothetical protein